MNIVDYVIIAILAYGLLSGMYKGSIASGLSTLGFVGAWAGAKAVYAKIAHMALSNTTLMAVLNQYLEPDSFFESHSQAVMNVKDVIAGGEEAISAAVESGGSQFKFIASVCESGSEHDVGLSESDAVGCGIQCGSVHCGICGAVHCDRTDCGSAGPCDLLPGFPRL